MSALHLPLGSIGETMRPAAFRLRNSLQSRIDLCYASRTEALGGGGCAFRPQERENAPC